MFVGATFRLGLNQRTGEPGYRTTLGISGMSRNPVTSGIRVGNGLELAFTGKKKPALNLAGMELGQLRRTANMSGEGKAVLIAGGVALALGIGVLVALDSLPCTDGDDPCD